MLLIPAAILLYFLSFPLPSFVSKKRRSVSRIRIRVVAGISFVAPWLLLAFGVLARVEHQRFWWVVLGSFGAGVALWFATLVWAFVGEREQSETRGFSIIAAPSTTQVQPVIPAVSTVSSNEPLKDVD